MITLSRLIGFCLLLSACGQTETTQSKSSNLEAPVSGYTFLQPETQRLQDDEFENPGYLWVEGGASLFADTSHGAPACQSCHTGDEALEAAATRYPDIDAKTGALLNLEGRINTCRERHQNLPALPYESEDLLALTAYVASLSKGLAIQPSQNPRIEPHVTNGRDYFFTKRGHMNLSCAQCHNDNWGKQLRGDTISQGHGNGFPAYRLEWQTMGSLHRRLHDCDLGVRAQPMELGSQAYLEVEAYLARRAAGLEIETPAVRR